MVIATVSLDGWAVMFGTGKKELYVKLL